MVLHRLHALRALFGLACCAVVLAQSTEHAAYLGNGPLYHSNGDIFNKFKSLASNKGNFLRVSEIRDNTTTNTLQLVTITDFATAAAGSSSGGSKDQNVSKASSGADSLSSRPQALIICGQHAREVISSEICYWLVRMLTDDAATMASWPEFQEFVVKGGKAAKGATEAQLKAAMDKWAQKLRSKLYIEVVPVVNAPGRKEVEQGDFSLRKTVRTQVDLNRNWPVGWSVGNNGNKEDFKISEEWKGPRPLSEWQTRAIYNHVMAKNATTSRPRSIFLDIHSGTAAIILPWNYKRDFSDINPKLVDAWQPWADKINRLAGGIRATNGPAALYISEGAVSDTMLKDGKFPYSACLEVYSTDLYKPAHLRDSSGVKCPSLRDLHKACKQPGCGKLQCTAASGKPLSPGLGDESKAVAMMAKEYRARAAAAAAAAHAPMPPVEVMAALEAKKALLLATYQRNDPFMHRLSSVTSLDPDVFPVFNPPTVPGYRRTVAMWVVNVMQAMEHAADHPVSPALLP